MLSTAFLLTASMVVSQADQSSPLPKNVAAWLQYEMGTWESKGKIGENSYAGKWSARWAPGKHCSMLTLSSVPNRPEESAVQMTGITGYDPVSKRFIENSFWSNGAHYTISWDWDASNPIRDRGIIEGELTGVENGKEIKTKATVERKGREEFTYISQTVDGEPIELVFRKIEEPKRAKAKLE